GVPLDHVRVVYGDTHQAPFNLVGTGGSRAATWATGSVLVTARQLKQQILAIASHQMEIGADDLDIVDGVVAPKGVPSKGVPLTQVAAMAVLAPGMLPPGTDISLTAQARFDGTGITGSGWSGGTHACIVEVDVATGFVRLQRYVVVEDCGRGIDPTIGEGP